MVGQTGALNVSIVVLLFLRPIKGTLRVFVTVAPRETEINFSRFSFPFTCNLFALLVFVLFARVKRIRGLIPIRLYFPLSALVLVWLLNSVLYINCYITLLVRTCYFTQKIVLKNDSLYK